jgi:hypothetical protein
MNEKLRELQALRPEIRHQIGLSVEDQMLEKHPEYFERVVSFIQRLGMITEKEGHSQKLDEIKNSAYRLIGI